MICPHCHKEHSDQAMFCPVTGLPIQKEKPAICPNCSIPFTPDDTVCAVCGYSIVTPNIDLSEQPPNGDITHNLISVAALQLQEEENLARLSSTEKTRPMVIPHPTPGSNVRPISASEKYTTCPFCYQQHPENAKFCPVTGKDLPVGSETLHVELPPSLPDLVEDPIGQALAEQPSAPLPPTPEAEQAAAPPAELDLSDSISTLSEDLKKFINSAAENPEDAPSISDDLMGSSSSQAQMVDSQSAFNLKAPTGSPALQPLSTRKLDMTDSDAVDHVAIPSHAPSKPSQPIASATKQPSPSAAQPVRQTPSSPVQPRQAPPIPAQAPKPASFSIKNLIIYVVIGLLLINQIWMTLRIIQLNQTVNTLQTNVADFIRMATDMEVRVRMLESKK